MIATKDVASALKEANSNSACGVQASNGHSSNGYVTHGVAQPSAGAGDMNPEEYRREHDLTVMGDNVPPPIQSFEAAGFTPDILDEVPSTPL